MKQYILIGVAVICAILAFALVKVNLDRMRQRLYEGAEKVDVLVVGTLVLQGQPIDRANLGLRSIYRRDLTGQETFKEDVDRVVGTRSAVDVPAHAPLLWTYISEPVSSIGGKFAGTIKPNERAMTVPVDVTTSVAGLIRPNDHVDILGTFRFPADTGNAQLDTLTLTVLQNVTVLAVDRTYAGNNVNAGRGYSSMTLSVTPKEAEFLIFAMEKGKLTFTLRNPHDVYFESELPSVNFLFLEQNVQKYMTERQKRIAPQK